MTAFSYSMAASGDLEIRISGEIGGWSDGTDCCTARDVKKALKSVPNAKTIRVHIESLGGSFFDGLGMYLALKEHGARVEVSVGSVAASAATLPMMAGDTISMDATSLILIHPVWTYVDGSASELRKVADDLDLLSESAVKAYSERTGMDEDAIRSLMEENRFMGAEEALELGICTEIRKRKDRDDSKNAVTPDEARAMFESMKTQHLASATALRFAAMATPPVQSTQPEPSQDSPIVQTVTPAQSAPDNTREVMQMTFPISAVALGLPEGATDSEFSSKIAELKAAADASAKIRATFKASTNDEAVGIALALKANSEQSDAAGHIKVMAALGASTADEALGIIAAHQSAKDRLAQAEASLRELTLTKEQGERGEIVAKLESEGKCTPAQKETLFPTMSLETLKAFAKTAVPVLRGDGHKEPGKDGGYTGKPYSQMTNVERAELKRTNPDTFAMLRQQAIESGSL